MRVRQTLLVILLVSALVSAPLSLAGAQSSSQVADLLREIATRITVDKEGTGRSGLCHGFVYAVRYQVAYVATAKHCIEELSIVPLRQAASLSDLGLSITVEYANGATGTVRYISWSGNYDAVMLVTSFTERPDSFSELCPKCRIYRTFGSERRIPVESVLSAGGGPPVISSGFVMSDAFGKYVVILPSSPGTSGSPVIDLQGNLVGIVITVATFRGADAGWMAGIVPGSTVTDLMRFAVEHYESPSQATPSRPTTPAPGLPAPPIPSGPTQPIPTPVSPLPSTSTDQFLIVPGQGIGSVRLGMSITDVTAVLGRPKVTLPYSKTSNDTMYSWFEYTSLENGTARVNDGGLTVVCSQTGQVTIVQAYYAPQYVTAEGLHTGMTEEQVRSALGEPSKVEKLSGYHSLVYLSQGITFRMEDDPHVRGYRTVYLIKVYAPEP